MGNNKRTRKQIVGHRKNIEKHLEKIRQELQKAQPDRALIDKWQNKDIAKALREIEKLERKLPRGAQ